MVCGPANTWYSPCSWTVRCWLVPFLCYDFPHKNVIPTRPGLVCAGDGGAQARFCSIRLWALTPVSCCRVTSSPRFSVSSSSRVWDLAGGCSSPRISCPPPGPVGWKGMSSSWGWQECQRWDTRASGHPTQGPACVTLQPSPPGAQPGRFKTSSLWVGGKAKD